jgi:general stress protein 26
MEVQTFAEIRPEFMARVSQAVYCTMATVDRLNRPRSRIMHPVWDGPTGWVISWPESHKARQLAHNPYVSLAYIHDKENPVYADCRAEWIDNLAEKQRIWELHQTLPAQLGFDPQPHYGSIHNPYYGLLKLTPWRIELAHLGGEPVIWRNSNT